MSEWLTTGEMIDRLRVGEVAESKGERYKVKFIPSFGIYYVGDDEIIMKQYGADGKFYIPSSYLRDMKWRILPKYVTFEEAKKAYEEGKKVKCTYSHYNNDNIIGTEIYSNERLESSGAISWYLITKGKWQIIE